MPEKEKIKVLFVCTGNSCRSQMAEGMLRHLAGDKFTVMSAGSNPAVRISPYAVEVMREIGVDISKQHPKPLDSVADEDFDFVITLCGHAAKLCPEFQSKSGTAKKLHWAIPDPYEAGQGEEEILKIYREARDLIKERIMEWLQHGSHVSRDEH